MRRMVSVGLTVLGNSRPYYSIARPVGVTLPVLVPHNIWAYPNRFYPTSGCFIVQHQNRNEGYNSSIITGSNRVHYIFRCALVGSTAMDRDPGLFFYDDL